MIIDMYYDNNRLKKKTKTTNQTTVTHNFESGMLDISNQCNTKPIIYIWCLLTTLAGGFSGSFSGCLIFVLSMLIGTASKHRSWTSSSIQTVKGVRIQHIYSRHKDKGHVSCSNMMVKRCVLVCGSSCESPRLCGHWSTYDFLPNQL